MPRWIHSRAEHLLAKNPKMNKSQAFAIATQQSHSMGKSPKGYGTKEGKSEAKEKYDAPKKEYEKKPNPGSLESPKMGSVKLADAGTRLLRGVAGAGVGGTLGGGAGYIGGALAEPDVSKGEEGKNYRNIGALTGAGVGALTGLGMGAAFPTKAVSSVMPLVDEVSGAKAVSYPLPLVNEVTGAKSALRQIKDKDEQLSDPAFRLAQKILRKEPPDDPGTKKNLSVILDYLKVKDRPGGSTHLREPTVRQRTGREPGVIARMGASKRRNLATSMNLPSDTVEEAGKGKYGSVEGTISMLKQAGVWGDVVDFVSKKTSKAAKRVPGPDAQGRGIATQMARGRDYGGAAVDPFVAMRKRAEANLEVLKKLAIADNLNDNIGKPKLKPRRAVAPNAAFRVKTGAVSRLTHLVLPGVTGAALGAGSGAVIDDENRARGALIGSAVGGASGLAGGHFSASAARHSKALTDVLKAEGKKGGRPDFFKMPETDRVDLHAAANDLIRTDKRPIYSPGLGVKTAALVDYKIKGGPSNTRDIPISYSPAEVKDMSKEEQGTYLMGKAKEELETSKTSFAQSQYSGPLGGGRPVYTSYIPPFRSPPVKTAGPPSEDKGKDKEAGAKKWVKNFMGGDVKAKKKDAEKFIEYADNYLRDSAEMIKKYKDPSTTPTQKDLLSGWIQDSIKNSNQIRDTAGRKLSDVQAAQADVNKARLQAAVGGTAIAVPTMAAGLGAYKAYKDYDPDAMTMDDWDKVLIEDEAAANESRKPDYSKFKKTAAKPGYEDSETAKRNRARTYGTVAGGATGALGGLGAASYGMSKAYPHLGKRIGPLAALALSAGAGAGAGLAGGYAGSKAGKAIANKVIGPPPSKRKKPETEKEATVAGMRDELEKLNNVMSPQSQLGKHQSIGMPKTTSPPGPSIQQISKPIGFGRPQPGATKSGAI